MRIIRSVLLLLIAAALVTGCFYYLDTNFDGKDVQGNDITVTSGLTNRVYALEDAMTVDKQAELEMYEAELDREIAAYLKQHGGGTYTASSGDTVYVAGPSSSVGGYYSGNGGGYSGGSGGGGSSGGWNSSGGGSGESGSTYEIDIDDTEYNICHACGTEYTGTGGCPNPDCEAYHPGDF